MNESALYRTFIEKLIGCFYITLIQVQQPFQQVDYSDNVEPLVFKLYLRNKKRTPYVDTTSVRLFAPLQATELFLGFL
jgi:hypothetical protein